MRNFLLTILIVAFVGCEKATQPSQETAADYLPIKSGSTWEYFYNGDYAHGVSIKAGTDTTIKGKTYRTQHHKMGNEAVYIYRFSGNDIYSLDNRQNEELIFKMADAGTSWSSTIQHDSVNYSVVQSSVAAKGLTMEVYGNTFKNVIHIKSLIANYYDGNTFSNEYVSNRYFAKDVGIIREDVEDGNTGFINGLKSYSIK